MKLESLQQLLVAQLGALLDAEQQVARALPAMIDAASAPELVEVFQRHLSQSAGQVRRLKEAFEILGLNPVREPCDGMKGLIKEGRRLLHNDSVPWVLDAALVGAAQKVEHYEMATYRSARTWAQELRQVDVADLMQLNLDEESAADNALSDVAETLDTPAA